MMEVVVMMIIRKTMLLMTTNICTVITMFHYCPEIFVNINFFNHRKSNGTESTYTLIISVKKPKHRDVNNLPKVIKVKRDDEASICTQITQLTSNLLTLKILLFNLSLCRNSRTIIELLFQSITNHIYQIQCYNVARILEQIKLFL